jgi:hypothetical protein
MVAVDDDRPMSDSAALASALEGALRARPEVVERADRCRAMLGDLLAGDGPRFRREVALLVAAVEEGAVSTLLDATSPDAVERVVERFQADRSLSPDAARSVIALWIEALRSVGHDSIPSLHIAGATTASVDTEPTPVPTPAPTAARTEPHATLPGDLTPTVPGDLSRPLHPAGDLSGLSIDVASIVSEPAGAAQPRGARRAWIPLVAGVSVIALVVAGVALFAGGDEKDTSKPTGATKATEVTDDGGSSNGGNPSAPDDVAASLEFAALHLSDAVTMTRHWELRGDSGDAFVGELTFTSSAAGAVYFDEVIPKSIAATSLAVEFDYDANDFRSKPEWVKRDPVFRVHPQFSGGGGEVTMRYLIDVGAQSGPADRLKVWQDDLVDAQADWVNENDTEGPALAVDSPKAGATLTGVPFTIRGTVEDDATVRYGGVARKADGSFKGAHDVDVNSKGQWKVDNIVLDTGRWFVKIIATDAAGNATTKIFSVTYAPVTPPTDGGPDPTDPTDPDIPDPCTSNCGDDADGDGVTDSKDWCVYDGGVNEWGGCPAPNVTISGERYVASYDEVGNNCNYPYSVSGDWFDPSSAHWYGAGMNDQYGSSTTIQWFGDTTIYIDVTATNGELFTVSLSVTMGSPVVGNGCEGS